MAARALATFAGLAEVEAGLHRRPVDQVHFHEVGGHDTIIDVVGTAAALEVLGVDEVRSSAVATGTGMVRAAHGMLPNPAPAVVGLLQGIPTWGRDVPVELTTPTGAALLAALSSGFGPMPAMVVTAQGFGAGSRELEELPNCTQVVVGTRVDAAGGPEADAGQPVAVLEVTLDDVTGEQLAHAVGALLEAGAHDAWLSPVLMKKGRPGHVVHVLCDPADVRGAAGRAADRDGVARGADDHGRAVAGGPDGRHRGGRRSAHPGEGHDGAGQGRARRRGGGRPSHGSAPARGGGPGRGGMGGAAGRGRRSGGTARMGGARSGRTTKGRTPRTARMTARRPEGAAQPDRRMWRGTTGGSSGAIHRQPTVSGPSDPSPGSSRWPWWVFR